LLQSLGCTGLFPSAQGAKCSFFSELQQLRLPPDIFSPRIPHGGLETSGVDSREEAGSPEG